MTYHYFPKLWIDTSNVDINNDLFKISKWAYQCKMLFNPDINKQATEIYFSQRREESFYPPSVLSSNSILSSPSQKHLAFVLDNKFSLA